MATNTHTFRAIRFLGDYADRLAEGESPMQAERKAGLDSLRTDLSPEEWAALSRALRQITEPHGWS